MLQVSGFYQNDLVGHNIVSQQFGGFLEGFHGKKAAMRLSSQHLIDVDSLATDKKYPIRNVQGVSS